MTHTTTHATVTLVDGYDRNKKPKTREFRVLGLEEIRSWAELVAIPCTCTNGTFEVTVSDADHAERIKTLRRIECNAGETVTMPCSCAVQGHTGIQYRDITPSHVWFVAIDGKARTAKVNGKVRTWKRDKTRVELPVKYGMYEFATFDRSDIENGRVLLPV